MVDQLNRMSARISLLKLLMHSTSHRKLLMKILNGAYVERGISLYQFEGIIVTSLLMIILLLLRKKYLQKGGVITKLCIFL